MMSRGIRGFPGFFLPRFAFSPGFPLKNFFLPQPLFAPRPVFLH